MAVLNLKELDVDFWLRGDGSAARTITIGRNDTANDIIIFDVTNFGIGAAAPANVNFYLKDVDSGFTEMRIDAGAAGQDAFINFHEAGTHEAKIGWDASDNCFRINTVGTPSFTADDFAIDESGNVLIGGKTAAASSIRNLHLFNGTIPTAGPTNGVVLYAKDVAASSELHVMDEANNETLLSPHDENGEWHFFSENKKTGKRFRVRMERFFRKMAELFPDEIADLVEDIPGS